MAVAPAEELVEEAAPRSGIVGWWRNYQSSRQAAEQTKLVQQALEQQRKKIADSFFAEANEKEIVSISLSARQMLKEGQSEQIVKEYIRSETEDLYYKSLVRDNLILNRTERVAGHEAATATILQDAQPPRGIASWWDRNIKPIFVKPKPEVPAPPAAVVEPVAEPAEELVEEAAPRSGIVGWWRNYQSSRQAAQQAKLAQQALTQSRENVADSIVKGINLDLDTQLQAVAGKQFANPAEAQAQAKRILETQFNNWQATPPNANSYIYTQAYDRLKSLQPDLPEEQWAKMAGDIEAKVVAQQPGLISRQLDRLQTQTVEIAQSTTPKTTTAVGLDQGLVRTSQQDAIFTTSSMASSQGKFAPQIQPNTKEIFGDLSIAADGMGGMQGGERASHNAIVNFYQRYYDPTFQPGQPIEQRMAAAAKEANAAVYNDLRGSGGTTLTATVLKNNELTIAHVGDTRAYLVRGNNIQQLTTDHSLPGQQNILLRAVGSKPNVTVDTKVLQVQPGDKIVLCSDGLNKHVTDQQILKIVTNSNPQQAQNQLINLTNQNGGIDNTAVIIQEIGEPTTIKTTQTTIQVKPMVEVKPKGVIDKVIDWFRNIFSSRLVESAFAAEENAQPMSLYLYQAISQNRLLQEKLAGRKPEELSSEELNQIILEALQESETATQAKQEKIGQDFQLFTGIDGSSQYELAPGSYRIKIKSLPDLGFSAPAVINIASGTPQELEIGLRRGGENVSRPAPAWPQEETTNTALLTVALYHDENNNHQREAEEKTVKWAGVEIDLEKITPLPYSHQPLFWCNSYRVLNAAVHQSRNQCYLCVQTGLALGQNVFKVTCPDQINKESSGLVKSVHAAQPETESQVRLLEGWNLISLAVSPPAGGEPMRAMDLVTEINKQGGLAVAVSQWQNSAWQTYLAGLEKNNFLIEPGQAYFVENLSAVEVIFTGQPISEPLTLNLRPGWNAVGFPQVSEVYSAETLLDQSPSLETAGFFESGLWLAANKKDEEFFGINFPLLPGLGYFLKAIQPLRLTP